MKKLKKKAEISRKTIERFYCRCGCGCLLWFNTSDTATTATDEKGGKILPPSINR